MLFVDRRDAGRQLAASLAGSVAGARLRVLALPRGGVPVGYEVARALRAPLDVFLVRKLGVPGHEELAMGAIATGGLVVLNPDVVQALEISPETIEAVCQKELEELQRRQRAYRDDLPEADLGDCSCLLVDDGLATGASMQAAVQGVRRQHPAEVIVAVPVAAVSTARRMAALADQFFCVAVREPFLGVGYWYEDFSQTSDEEVRQLLAQAKEPQDKERSQG